MTKIAVLCSGGIDSTVVAHMVHSMGSLGPLIHFNFGQAVFEAQSAVVRRLAANLGTRAIVAEFDYKKMVGSHHPLMHHGFKPSKPFRREDEVEEKSLSLFPDYGYLNGRNALFMLQAAIIASYNNCNKLATGTQHNDDMLQLVLDGNVPVGVDTTSHTVSLVNSVILNGFPVPFCIFAPLEGFNKLQVVMLAKSLNVDLSDTVSCEYSPTCGICDQCNERAEVFKLAGV